MSQQFLFYNWGAKYCQDKILKQNKILIYILPFCSPYVIYSNETNLSNDTNIAYIEIEMDIAFLLLETPILNTEILVKDALKLRFVWHLYSIFYCQRLPKNIK